MQILYLLPWFILVLLMLLGTIVSTRTFEHISQRNHAPEMSDSAFSIRGFLRNLKEEKLLVEETMSAQEPL